MKTYCSTPATMGNKDLSTHDCSTKMTVHHSLQDYSPKSFISWTYHFWMSIFRQFMAFGISIFWQIFDLVKNIIIQISDFWLAIICQIVVFPISLINHLYIWWLVFVVRATSVLCLLGLGLGLGSILIYRLCSRLFASGNATQTPSLTARGRRRSSQSSLDENSDSRRLSPQTPSDSGISTSSMVTMGNNASGEVFSPDEQNVHYNTRDGVRFRGRFSQEDAQRSFKPPFQSYGADSELRKQLSINIPGEISPVSHSRHMTISSTGSEDPSLTDSFRSTRHTSDDQISLMPNFSPDSLYEKNFRYRDFESSLASQSELTEDPFSSSQLSAKDSDTDFHDSQACKERIAKVPVSDSEAMKQDQNLNIVITDSVHRTPSGDHRTPTLKDTDVVDHNTVNQDQLHPTAYSHQSSPSPGNRSPQQSPRHPILRQDRLTPALERILSNTSSPLRSSTASLRSLESSDLSNLEDFAFNSLDMSDASGIATPEGELLGSSSQVGADTEEGMKTLEGELANIMEEIEEMSEKMNKLQGKSLEDISESAKSAELSTALRVLKRHKTRDRMGWSRSVSVSDAEQTVVNNKKDFRKTYHHSGEFSFDEDTLDESLRRRAPPLNETRSPRLQSHTSLEVDSAGIVMETDDLTSESETDSGLLTIGERVNVVEYADREWKGTTDMATRIKQGYYNLEDKTGRSHLRRIRGDNFCAPRAVVFQSLCGGIPVCSRWGSYMEICQKLEQLKDYAFLQNWQFLSSSPEGKTDLFERALECVKELYDQISVVHELPKNQREDHVVNLLNSDRDLDLRIMDAVKVIMMAAAIELFEMSARGEDVPTFAWLMYARETSENPAEFYTNHLKPLGKEAGLEQVEMFLLSYALSVSIDIARLKCFDQEDFITSFCYDNSQKHPAVLLVAEDDRHYNVLV